MALAGINVKNRAKRKYGTVAQEIQFSGFYRSSNKYFTESYAPFALSNGFQAAKNRYSCPFSEEKWLHLHSQKNILLKKAPFFVAKQLCAASKRQTITIKLT